MPPDLLSAPPVAALRGAFDTAAAVASSPDVGVACSKVLSAGVVAGAAVGKLPQVCTIWRTGSAQGISASAVWAEAAGTGVQLAYNVVRETPPSTYAELPLLFPQLLLLAVTAAWAEGHLGLRVWLACGGISGATAAMAIRAVPEAVTTALYASNAVLGLAAVGPQIIMNWRNSSTGQLSFVVYAMTFAGLTTRLFTTFVEVQDVAVRLAITFNWLLVAVLMLQFWAYRPRPVGVDRVQATAVAARKAPRRPLVGAGAAGPHVQGRRWRAGRWRPSGWRPQVWRLSRWQPSRFLLRRWLGSKVSQPVAD